MNKARSKISSHFTDKLPKAKLLKRTKEAATVAGLSLLVMTILSPIAHFGVLQELNQESLNATLEMIGKNQIAIMLAIISLVMVIILDGFVAIALFKFLQPSKQKLNRLMAWSRIAYAAIFLLAISFLVVMVVRVDLSSSMVTPLAISDLKGFYVFWDIALVVFAFHLILLGWLFYKAKYTPTWLGALLAIAGLGYAIDSFAKYTIDGYNFEISTTTFIGEAILIVWLLIWGRRLKSGDLKKS